MITVVGESLIDVGAAGETVGGSPLNVAVGLGRLDVPVVLITELGRDARAATITRYVAEAGVELEVSVSPSGVTSSAIVTDNPGAGPEYDLDLSWNLPHQQLPDCDALHVGSLATVLEPGRNSVLDLVEQAWALDVFVSYDPNVRAGSQEAWGDVESIGERAQLIKLSEQDVALLHPGADPGSIARTLLTSDRTELVVLTRGAGGCTGFADGVEVHVPATEVALVDTVGAGDAFTAAILTVLLESDAFGSYAGGLPLDEAGLTWLLTAATEAAALSCTRAGAAMPLRSELPPDWPGQPPVG